MRRRFSEAEILGFLREAATGTPVMDLCWNHCVSRSTFRAWKMKYGSAIDAELDRLMQLERENSRLRQALARASPEIEPKFDKRLNSARNDVRAGHDRPIDERINRCPR